MPQLKEACRNSVFEQLVRMAEDIDFKFPMKKACHSELDKFCKDSPSCTQEVDSFSVIQSKDPLSLDVPLQKACQGDLVKLCPDVSRDHARTLSCLRTKREKLSTSCREEEMRFSIMEVGPGWWGEGVGYGGIMVWVWNLDGGRFSLFAEALLL
ncbi:unnamed protein product, partial [Closterium sp. NIES-53]